MAMKPLAGRMLGVLLFVVLVEHGHGAPQQGGFPFLAPLTDGLGKEI
jgi:hypothetical protein